MNRSRHVERSPSVEDSSRVTMLQKVGFDTTHELSVAPRTVHRLKQMLATQNGRNFQQTTSSKGAGELEHG